MSYINAPSPIDPDVLAERFGAMKTDRPHLRIREAATRLNVSEMELLALGCGDNVVRLRSDDFPALIGLLPDMGPIMALTRNESAVHERKGAFGNVSIYGAMGVVLNKEIDLRLFMNHWAHGFIETKDTGTGPLTSLQFFDHEGGAVHKVYMTENARQPAFDHIRRHWAGPDQSRTATVTKYRQTQDTVDKSGVDARAFAADWRALKDVHHFFAMLKRHKIARTDALRLIGEEFACRLHPSAAWELLQKVAGTGFSIMVFVGNRGCIQIHTGPVKTVRRADQWANVLDPMFNLHLREDLVAEAWLVRKPTKDGPVHSLELYDASGQVIAQFFSERHEGEIESTDWAPTLHSLPKAA